MQVIIHTGAHNTDNERLMKSLLKNRGSLLKQGVAIPGPGKYRRLLRKTLMAMRKAPAGENTREVLLDAILDGAQPDRVILSNANFFCVPPASVHRGKLYPQAVERLIDFQKLFPDDEIEIFMALCDPGSFLPAVFEKSPETTMDEFLGHIDPHEVLWSNMIALIREHLPNIAVTVWCNEDTPLIWSEIIREMTGLEYNAPIEGAYDLLADIMSTEGMKRFDAYLELHPDMPEIHRRRVIAAFLGKFALEDAIEEELDLPDWDETLLADLSDIYEEDVLMIGRMPGVQLISP